MIDNNETVVGEPRWVPFLWWLGFPLVGAGAGWLLAWVAHWVVALPWAPMQGPFRILEAIPDPFATLGAILFGVGAGFALAVKAQQEQLTVIVGGDRVRLVRAEATTTLVRTQLASAFLDDKELVLLGPAGQELAREATDLPAEQLQAAFARHGYRWHDGGDPYQDEYRRWVPGMPGLPEGADALLRARERALTKEDHPDATQLRAELAKLGVVVRQDESRQFWRPILAAGENPEPPRAQT